MKKKRNVKKILLITAAVLLGLYLFLIIPRLFNRPDMSSLRAHNFAHRGYHDNENGIPENSLLSFEQAIAHGYGIELDVQLSSDGVAMVFHDKDLERVCGVSGAPWDYTAAELKELRLFGTEERIPTLAEALELIDGQVPVLVEYKMDKVDTGVCAAGEALLKDYEGEYYMQCFHPLALMWYRKNAPEVARGQLMQDYMKQEQHAGDPVYFLLSRMVANVATRPDFISYRYSDEVNVSIRICELLGARMLAWTLPGETGSFTADIAYDAFIFNRVPTE